MIKGNLGTITVKENTGLIADEKFFVETFPLKDGIKGMTTGAVLGWSAEKTKLFHINSYTDEPVAVLCETIEGTSKDTHARCLVFGRVNLNALTVGGMRVADATAEEKRTIIESLRKIGIYATEGEE